MKRAIILVIACISLAGCEYTSDSSQYTDGVSTNSYSSGGAYESSINKSVEGFDANGYSGSESADIESQSIENYSKSEDTSDIKNTKASNNTLKMTEDKIIYTANVDIEHTDSNEAIPKIKEKLAQNKGIIQTERMNDGRSYQEYSDNGTGYVDYSLSVRVPSENFNSFISELKSIGHVIRLDTSADNINQQYYDTKAQIDSYKNQLNTLQKMYDKANSLDELLKVESRITEVNTQMSRLNTQLLRMDTDVAYSTINIHLQEVEVFSESEKDKNTKAFSTELKEAFKESYTDIKENVQGFILFIASNIIQIVVITGVIILAILRLKKIYSTTLNTDKQNKQDKQDKQDK